MKSAGQRGEQPQPHLLLLSPLVLASVEEEAFEGARASPQPLLAVVLGHSLTHIHWVQWYCNLHNNVLYVTRCIYSGTNDKGPSNIRTISLQGHLFQPQTKSLVP